MTTGWKLSTKGLEESLEALVALGRDIDDAAATALLAGCEVMQEEMKSLAPELTGNLKAHIQIDGPHQDGNYIFCEVGVIHKIEFTDADTARYANVQEYGSASTPAHPYIRPGIDRARNKANRAIRDSLAEALTR